MAKAGTFRRFRTLQTAAVLAGLIAVLYLARAVLVPLAFALMLTLILTPAVDRLASWGLRRAAATIFVVFLSAVAAGGIGLVIFNQLIGVLDELPSYQQNIEAKLAVTRTPSNTALGRAADNIRKLAQEFSSGPADAQKPKPPRRTPDPAIPQAVRIVPEAQSDLSYVGGLVKEFLGPLGECGVVIIVTIFLLIEQSDVRDRLFRLAGLSRLYLVTRALDDAARRVSRYLRLQFSVNVIFGILFGLGLYAIGLPYAALWGAVAGLFRIVPYVGSATAGLMPLVLSLAVFDHWTQPAMVLALFGVLELVTANIIEPMVYGAHTGISSLMLLLSTVFWAMLWGPAGLILSTPLTVCLVVLGRHVPQFACLHILLGDEPVLAAAAQLYQRLLAADDAGARAIVTRQLEGGSVVQLYDTVVLPALALIKRDQTRGELDAERQEAILNSLREIVGEVSPRLEEPKAEDGIEVAAESEGRVVCIPASGECDEIAAALLAQVITASGGAAVALPADAKLPQITRLLKPSAHDYFCIAALPPNAFARARLVSGNLQRRYPQTPVVIGAWGYSGDPSRALERFEPARPKAVVTTLAAAAELMVPPATGPDTAVSAGSESAELTEARG